ncbi:deoxyribonuclease-2-alpha-like [Symphorus nematophorus]
MSMAGYRTMMRFIIGVGILFQGCDSDVKCRNDNGKEVDWYILYKLPKESGKGLTYLYMDENTNGWTLSKKKINSASGTLGNTLKPLLDFYIKKTEGFGYMLYNEQPLKTASSSFGHSKGVVMLDRQTGVWLSHSTPRFPTYRSKDFWPNSGTYFAQTFMCVTYPYSQFKEIGLQLKYIHVYTYDYEIPTTFHNELRCVAQRSCYPNSKPWFSVKTLTSVGGKMFSSIAKYKRFADDLYSGLIVNHLKQNLYVRFWGKVNSPRLPSNCSNSIPHHVYNVKTVRLNGESLSDMFDHSKWCVTTGGDVTCIADLNRQVSQMKRGGGAICTNDVKVGRAFYALITKYEPCKRPRPRPPADVKHNEL